MTVTESLPVARVQASRLGHVPALDGLRAVAITLVVVYHAIMPAHFGGAGGVDVFFVLSGFLITTLLLEEYDARKAVSFRRFYFRRLARLGPPLVLMLAVVLVPIAITMGLTTALGGTALSLFYVMPIGAESGATTLSPYEHTWSLGVEEWFYALWPPVLVWILRGRRRWALVGAAATTGILVLAAFAAEAQSAEVSFILRACGLMAGCVVAVAMHRTNVKVGRWAGIAGLALLGLSVLRSSIEPFSTIDVVSSDLGTLLLVLAIVRGPEGPLWRALSLRPVAYVGRISYEIYLWHYPVLCILGVLNHSDWLEVGWIAIAASFVLAVIAHRVTRPVASALRSRMARWIPA
ncbi:acyltransferase [Sinomonas sp. ASV322]|uniref:acyltransferase family protein n=1 Tax=Sinomonas sp. ASV322 TaxID=3041920 RepID=UPI0027DCFB29|nr:acyltransferase [Sinomonas sp. ASV322]MDQ4501752.1 acyltransferase [Sinomonas sp. ASV322]